MDVVEVTASAVFGGRFLLYRVARGLWQGARLYRVLDAASRLPAPLGPRFTRMRLRAKLWGGADALVPEQELREAYTSALQDVLSHYGSARPVGDYLEFGVYTGTSLACMHDASSAIGLSTMRLFGFDSFEGLPEAAAADDDGQWRPGTFRSDLDLTRAALSKRGVDWDRVELVAGWYDDTLTPETVERLGLRCASVVMIDCDNYSSAKRALVFCEPLIQGETFFFFDDWNTRGLADQNLGEKRALDELLADHPDLEAARLEAYSPTAAVFRVTRVPAGTRADPNEADAARGSIDPDVGGEPEPPALVSAGESTQAGGRGSAPYDPVEVFLLVTRDVGG